MDTKKFLVIMRQVEEEDSESYTGLVVEAETKEAAAADALESWLIRFDDTGYVALVVDLAKSFNAVFTIRPHYGSVTGFSRKDYSLDDILCDAGISSILTRANANRKI